MNLIESLFGRSKTPAERLRAHQRSLQKAQRELDRERTKLEQQEKKLIADIKASAKKGQMSSCKVMAKDLVRTRRYISKFYSMKTQLQAVSLRIQTLRSNQQMAEAMKGATKAMSMMSKQMNLPQISKILMDFEKESSMMDMKQEMMSDAIDDVMEDEGEGEEEEGDRILEEVLAEIGISVGQQLGETPNSLPQSALSEPTRTAVAMGEGGPSASGAGGGEVDELQARSIQVRRSVFYFLLTVSTILNKPYDAFADVGEDLSEATNKKSTASNGVTNYIHIRIQQRNGRKTITTLQGVPTEYDPKKLLKAFKKEFACNGSLVDDEELGRVIQLQGDQRTKILAMLTEEGINKETIKLHGF